MSSSNVRSIASAPRDDRRKALDQDARVLFIRGMRAKGWDTTEAARECAGSVDAVEAWISGKRRVPGRALVAVGVTSDPLAAARRAA
jgi:hypothetical protein